MRVETINGTLFSCEQFINVWHNRILQWKETL